MCSLLVIKILYELGWKMMYTVCVRFDHYISHFVWNNEKWKYKKIFELKWWSWNQIVMHSKKCWVVSTQLWVKYGQNPMLHFKFNLNIFKLKILTQQLGLSIFDSKLY